MLVKADNITGKATSYALQQDLCIIIPTIIDYFFLNVVNVICSRL